MGFLASTGSLLIDGVSYGMVLFLISAGLTITLGVMRVVNLAHCGFAMIGGYAALALVQRWGVGLVGALLAATAFTTALGAILERTLYRWIYATSELGQILMTIGLAFVMVASVNLVFGSTTHTLPVPEWLSGTWQYGGVSLSIYRAFLIIVSVAIAIGLWCLLEFTEFGAKLRAAVDNPRMARCVGINVPRVFAYTFVGGCGLAAIGGTWWAIASTRALVRFTFPRTCPDGGRGRRPRQLERLGLCRADAWPDRYLRPILHSGCRRVRNLLRGRSQPTVAAGRPVRTEMMGG